MLQSPDRTYCGLQTGSTPSLLPPAPHSQQIPNTPPPNGPSSYALGLVNSTLPTCQLLEAQEIAKIPPFQTPMGPVLPLLKEFLNETHSLHSKAFFHPKLFPLNHSLSLVFLLGAYSLSKPAPNQNPKNLITPLIPSLELLKGFPIVPRKRPPIWREPLRVRPWSVSAATSLYPQAGLGPSLTSLISSE